MGEKEVENITKYDTSLNFTNRLVLLEQFDKEELDVSGM
jgi:hypothetical protein